ncbi:MAG: ATP-binding cassette domain-containing protein [Alphaproteobacteria bacterium]|nr:ATP-binding cassette domain-containing protein [Alphaproteobacteria bacterium]
MASPPPPPATPDGYIVRLADVRLDLAGPAGPVNVLRGVDLEVARGERLAIVGPSGSGKTTLLMVMAGLERASAGEVAVAGADFAGLDEDGLAVLRRGRIGIVFQSFYLVPTMSALENVAVPLELAGRGDAFARAAECLASVGLAARSGHYPGQLSGGEQQRVAVARAFAPQPALLLADEPTGNLDRATGEQVMDTLFALAAAHGTTLVLVTHDEAVAARCDRTVHIVDGRIHQAAA